MNKIESGYCPELTVNVDEDGDLSIQQSKDYVVVDKNQCKQLIKVLQEWVDE